MSTNSNKAKSLRRLWGRVEVKSCADGSMRIKPTWKGVRPYTEEDGGGPGLISRMAAATYAEAIINEALKGR